MSPAQRGRHRAAARLVVAGGLLAGLLVPVQSVAAVAPNVQAGLTITPTSTTAGSTVQIVATATNFTGSTIGLVSMGIDVPAPLHANAVSGSQCHPRNTGRLVYCGVANLAPHATATITISIPVAAAGSYAFRSYARQTYTTNDTFAYGTLTVR